MSRRKANEPLRKVTMNFYESDYVWLGDQFPTMGAQVAIRNLVREFRLRKESPKVGEAVLAELDIEL